MADQEEQKENEGEELEQPFENEQLTPENQPELKDEKAQPAQDGAIPQNAEGIVSGQFDVLDPIGKANITFEQGNYQQIAGIPKIVADKTAQLIQTFIPLVSVALIELLGSNSMYVQNLCNIQPSFDTKGNLSLNGILQYTVEHWIGTDIPYDAIQHDANYILEKIKPCKANITKCEIDTKSGLLIIQFTL